MARKTGCPLCTNLIIIDSATLSHSPCGLSIQVEYHFFSDPGPRNDHRPAGNLFAKIDTRSALALQSRSLSSDPQKIALNVDMKIIRPLNCDGSPILTMNSWTLLTSCIVVNPGKIFYANSIGSPSIVSKVLYCDELLNQLNFLPKQNLMLGSDLSFQDIRQNLKIRTPLHARD